MNNYIFGFELYYLVFYFIIFSFGGWLMETIRVSFRNKMFINRGFINGPFCPVYGIGMLFIIIFLSKLKNNYILLIISGTVLCSLLEYFTAWILEFLFHSKWWDYSYKKFNIKGRICLDISIAWGILSFIMIKLIVPIVDKLIEMINYNIGITFLKFFFIYFFVDVFITIYHLISFNVILNRLKNLKSEFFNLSSISDSIKNQIDYEVITAKLSSIKEKYNDISLKNFNSIHKRILKAFPKFHSIDIETDKVIEELKKKLRNRED